MPETSHISSLLLRARPERIDDVVRAIGALPAAEVHATDPAGRIIVTLETESEAVIVDAMNRIHTIDGVVSAALVYHEIDTEPDGKTRSSPTIAAHGGRTK